MSRTVQAKLVAPTSRSEAPAVVVFLAPGPDGVSLLGDVPESLLDSLLDAAAALALKGKADEVTRLPAPDGTGVTVLAGLGEVAGDAPTHEQVRRAAGAATRALVGVSTVAVVPPVDTAPVVAALVEGSLLGSYAFTRYRSEPAPLPPSQVLVLTRHGRARAHKAALDRSARLAAAINATRDLVNTAPVDLFPAAFAEIAEKAAKGTKVKVNVLDETALADGGYGGILGVGQGSVHPPRLVTLTYSPLRAKGHVALVGKGITFDSGGLSLKPPASMETMKSDMAGAAAVLHAVLAAADLGLPIKVTGYLALAENMPSGTAQRPSDVITTRDGTTVEVLNTDAEGRLVLADALADAVAGTPDAVLDIATLTGAQLVALGPRVTGVMGTETTRDAVVAAAGAAGEQAWPMPLPDELRASLDSTVADIANIGDRFGGMLVAGLFLKEFVGEVPWAHLDIAGPSFNERAPWGYTPKGGTGAGVRTLLSYLESFVG